MFFKQKYSENMHLFIQFGQALGVAQLYATTSLQARGSLASKQIYAGMCFSGFFILEDGHPGY